MSRTTSTTSTTTTNTNRTPVYGGDEIVCCNTGCQLKAYYMLRASPTKLRYLCGVHSRSLVDRVKMPKKPKHLKLRDASVKRSMDKIEVSRAQIENRDTSRRGRVIMSKLQMMKMPEDRVGFLKVFPNNRHQYRADGYGCCSLSPMRLGPVHHGQPNLPVAKNIENFHQGSKCFEQEIDPRTNEPTQLYYDNRLALYNDDTPHRRKYQGTVGRNKNIPVFFGWVDRNSRLCRLTYIESRQFYCTFYERLVVGNADLAHLRSLLDGGTNLQIVGYDARPVEATKDAIERAYLDDSAPFGHELVLLALLVLNNPNDYPWRKYKTFEF